MIIETNTSFRNDLCDVARLFFGDETMNSGVPAQDELLARHVSQDGAERAELILNGSIIESEIIEGSFPPCESLVGKRLRKRAAKTALYRILKRHTGQAQAWGSLTGIRPSRVLYDAMREMGDEHLAVRWLCDTFDVPVEKANLLADMLAQQSLTRNPSPEECDIYAGIPFCVTRCSYCAFAAMDMRAGAALVPEYMSALCDELKMSAELMRRAGRIPRAVYVGGGTPTTLSARELDVLLALLKSLFPEAYEWTVEAGRPDTIDTEKLHVMRGHGIGRVSINPQSMNEQTLSAIGRMHSASDVERAYELARALGFDTINMDMIAALPGEGVGDIINTTHKILKMRPENVTLHTLAIKRASNMRISGRAKLPPPEEARDMFEAARHALMDAGYRPYYLYRQKYMAGNLENIGLSLPGGACLYNIDHMEETAPILACGAGAITKWLFSRERRIERAPNVRDVRLYISRVEEMIRRKERIMFGR